MKRRNPFKKKSYCGSMSKITLGVLYCFCTTTALITSPSFAQELLSKDENKTKIIVDEEAGVIRFIINGEEAAQINSNGLSIRDNFEYGGTLLDIGDEYSSRKKQEE